MKWISYWMMAIAVIHCLVAVVLYGQAYKQFLANGILGSALNDYDRLAIWFFVAGLLIFLIGFLCVSLPRIPKLAGAIIAAVALVGGLLIPASGFWLLLPPAIGIMLARPNRTVN